MGCKYSVYVSVGPHPAVKMYQDEVLGGAIAQENTKNTQKVRKWIAANHLAWPVCNHGGKVDLVWIYKNQDKDANFYFFCSFCAQKERDDLRTRMGLFDINM